MSKKIVFKYHPNVYDNDIVTKCEGICECCGKEVTEYCETMYAEEDVECICLECISNGEAAEKFDGEFIQSAEKMLDEEKTEELFKRTPGYISWQGENWLTCCNDYCAFIGDVGTKELEEMEIADEVFADYDLRDEKMDGVREYIVKGGSTAGYLFKCLHCERYRLEVDCD